MPPKPTPRKSTSQKSTPAKPSSSRKSTPASSRKPSPPSSDEDDEDEPDSPKSTPMNKAEVQAELEAARRLNSTLKETLVVQNAKVKQLAAENDRLSGPGKEAQARIAQLERELAASAQRIQQLERELRDMATKEQALESQVGQSKEDLGALKEELRAQKLAMMNADAANKEQVRDFQQQIQQRDEQIRRMAMSIEREQQAQRERDQEVQAQFEAYRKTIAELEAALAQQRQQCAAAEAQLAAAAAELGEVRRNLSESEVTASTVPELTTKAAHFASIASQLTSTVSEQTALLEGDERQWAELQRVLGGLEEAGETRYSYVTRKVRELQGKVVEQAELLRAAAARETMLEYEARRLQEVETSLKATVQTQAATVADLVDGLGVHAAKLGEVEARAAASEVRSAHLEEKLRALEARSAEQELQRQEESEMKQLEIDAYSDSLVTMRRELEEAQEEEESARSMLSNARRHVHSVMVDTKSAILLEQRKRSVAEVKLAIAREELHELEGQPCRRISPLRSRSSPSGPVPLEPWRP